MDKKSENDMKNSNLTKKKWEILFFTKKGEKYKTNYSNTRQSRFLK